MDFDKVLSEMKDMVSKETRKLVKRLDQVEEKLQPRSLIQKKRRLEWIFLMENIYTMLEQPTEQEDKEELVQRVEVVKEMKKPTEKDYVTTLNEEPIRVNLEVPDSEGNDFEENKSLEDEVISSQSKEFKISPIAANNMQDLRTNLFQEREYDMIRAASKPRHVNEPIPNTRVQDFNEDFHGLSQDEWKMYKSWHGLIYASRSKMVNSSSKQLKRWLRSPKSFILHQIINGHDFWDSYEVSPHIGIF